MRSATDAALTTVRQHPQVETISGYAFNGCSQMADLRLPHRCTIGESVCRQRTDVDEHERMQQLPALI